MKGRLLCHEKDVHDIIVRQVYIYVLLFQGLHFLFGGERGETCFEKKKAQPHNPCHSPPGKVPPILVQCCVEVG